MCVCVCVLALVQKVRQTAVDFFVQKLMVARKKVCVGMNYWIYRIYKIRRRAKVQAAGYSG